MPVGDWYARAVASRKVGTTTTTEMRARSQPVASERRGQRKKEGEPEV